MMHTQRIFSASDLLSNCGRLVCEIHGVDVHLNFQPAASTSADTLIIGFHGSVDRSNRSVPAFIPFLPGVGGDVHQLTIADPSLRTTPEIAMAWFAGDSEFEAQKLLPDFFHSISQVLDVRRTIYFGTSGGGFAALFYSRQHSGSLALVGNPQTNISGFYPRHVTSYLSSCWPGVSSLAAISDRVQSDLSTVYSEGVIENYVLYLQNSTDDYHLFGHMAPFMSAIKVMATRKRIASTCFFPGKIGHNPVWEMFLPWLQAVIMSQDWMAQTILTTHHYLKEIKSEANGSVQETDENISNRKSLLQSSIITADFLRDYQLRKGK
jgi:hypothetical protein